MNDNSSECHGQIREGKLAGELFNHVVLIVGRNSGVWKNIEYCPRNVHSIISQMSFIRFLSGDLDGIHALELYNTPSQTMLLKYFSTPS